MYTPLQTVGDLVGLLDALKIPSAVLVGHDWGATHVWQAALLRPDRFKAVFCLSVPFVPRGDVSVFEKMRKSGHQDDFYMFEQSRPDADQIWADATVTIPDQVTSHHHIVAARQVNRWLALIILAVEEFIVFDRDVMRLVELD